MILTKRNKAQLVDWAGIRSRLAIAGEAIQHVGRLSPEAAAELLARRARALERPPQGEPLAAELMQLVTFSLAGERYGIGAEWVREIVRLTDFTPVPGAPPFVTGVINLRGEIVAVVDLRILFEIAARGLFDLLRVIVVGREKVEFGILAGKVHQVAALRTEELLEPSESIAGIGKELLKGVTRDGLVVIDGGKLLADSRLFVNQCKKSGV